MDCYKRSVTKLSEIISDDQYGLVESTLHEGVDFVTNLNVADDLKTFSLNDKNVCIEIDNPNFIHDFTFSMFGKLDVNLSGLTPDFLGEDFIAEFSTTVVDNFEMMTVKMKQKLEKYSHVEKKENKKLLVIIVSYSKLVSNFKLVPELEIKLIQAFNAIKQVQRHLLASGTIVWLKAETTKTAKLLDHVVKNSHKVKSKYDIQKSFELIDQNWDDFNMDHELQLMFDEIMPWLNDSIKNESYKETPFEYTPELHGRMDSKRITAMPTIIPPIRKSTTPFLSSFEDHDEIGKIIQEAFPLVMAQETNFGKNTMNDYKELRSSIKAGNIERKSESKFKVELSDSDLINLAIHGVQAKKLKNQKDVKSARLKSKEMFSFNTPVQDIEDFIQELKKLLKTQCKDVLIDPCHSLIKDSLLISGSQIILSDQKEDVESLRRFQRFDNSVLGRYLCFLNDLTFELNANLRTNVKEGEFIVRSMRRFNAVIYMKPTKSTSHLFFFVLAKNPTILSETVGPKLFKKDSYIITEWSSILKRDLENFIGIKERIYCTYQMLRQIHGHELFVVDNKAICEHTALITLLALNNKDRNEELITNLRYVYMKSLSITELTSNMLKKYPTCFRDRLSVYLCKKIETLCVKLDGVKPKFESEHGVIKIHGLKDIFDNDLTLKQAINFSYSGYIMTKVKQMQGNQSFQMIEKILKYELDSLTLTAESISIDRLEKEETHKFDSKWVRLFSEIAKTNLTYRYSSNFQTMIDEKIVAKFSNCNFETLSTLKASAKMDLLDEKSEFSLKKLKERRPRVVESLFNFVEGEPNHPLNLVNKCLEQIDNLDKFNVELFPKDQHNGLREIYVVDFRVRVLQWFIEIISRSICEMFPSETLNNIHANDVLTPKIMKNAYNSMDSPFTLVKSGDASKWSQSQITSKFYIVLKTFLPCKYHSIIASILKLWMQKKIFLPHQLLNLFDSNDFMTTNNLLMELHNGIQNVYNVRENFIRVKSGFMQGILHHTSSLFHTVVQEGFKQVKLLLTRRIYESTNFVTDCKTTSFWNMQGSDDSMEMLIVESKFYKANTRFFLALMHMKDAFSYKFGIIPSFEKTATCVPFVLEYNSNWSVSGINIQPTIKFAMVSCNIPTLQSLIQRQEYYYNLLLDCLEKGSTTYTCSLIKVAQASLNYHLLGSGNVDLFKLYRDLILQCRNPNLGYFILEPMPYTAVFGFDFSCYYHFKFGELLQFDNDEHAPMELQSSTKSTFRNNITISKMQWSNWKRLIETCGELTSSDKEFLEDNSYLYYSKQQDWSIEKLLIRQKLMDFDVKQSLSSKYGATENAAAFFILFHDVCKSGKEQKPLIDWVQECSKPFGDDKLEILKTVFPRWKTYDGVIDYLSIIVNQSYTIDVDYVRRGKSKVVVLQPVHDIDSDYLDIIVHKWFNKELSFVKSDHLLNKFDELKQTFPWLKDTEKETKEMLGCSSRQLANYLKSSLLKVRQLTFLDTTARDYGWKYLITRIFKDGAKLVRIGTGQRDVDENVDVMSNLKALSLLPYDRMFKKQTLTKIINEDLKFNELSPIKRMNFSILKSVLNEEDIDVIRSKILEKSRTQMVAYFQTAQTYDQTTNKWIGKGVVNFIIENLHGRLIMEDEIATKIEINDLENLIKDHREICKLIKNLHLQFHDNQTLTLRLTQQSIHNQTRGAEIVYIPTLHHDIYNLTNFQVAFERGNFKVVASQVDFGSHLHYVNLQTLYLVEIKQRPKTFEERKDVDDKGLIIKKQWIQDYHYHSVKHGDILDQKTLINGRDAKYTTIVNFEIWKVVLNPYCKELFNWGFLGTRIIRDEEISMQTLLDDILKFTPSATPINKIRETYLKKISFDDSLKDLAYKVMALDPKIGSIIAENKSKEEVQYDLQKEMYLLIANPRFDNLSVKSNELFTIQDFDSLIETETDFSFHKDVIFPDLKATFSLPANIFYYLRREVKTYIPEDAYLEDVFLYSRFMGNLPLRLQLILHMLFDTTIITRASTMKKLKDELFKSESDLSMEIASFSSKSSKSRRSIKTHALTDNSLKARIMRRFHIDIEDTELDCVKIMEKEIENLEEVIMKLELLIDEEPHQRLKFSMINQKVKFNDDLGVAKQLIDELKIEEKLKTTRTEEETGDDLQTIDEDESDKIDESGEDEKEIDDRSDWSSQEMTEESYEDPNEGVDPFKVEREPFELSSLDWLNYCKDIKFVEIKSLYEMIINNEDKKEIFETISKLTEMQVLYFGDGEMETYGDFELTLNIFDEEDSKIVYILTYDSSELNSKFIDIIKTKKLKSITPLPGMSCLFNALSLVLSELNIVIDQSMLRFLCSNYKFDEADEEMLNHQKEVMDINVMGNDQDVSAISLIFGIKISIITDYTLLTYNESGRATNTILINYDNIHFDAYI